MSIRALVAESEGLKAEIKITLAKLKRLRNRLKEVDNAILEYLDAKEQPGVKYEGKAIYIESKEKRKPKKKDAKLSDSLEVLRRYGIDDPEIVLNELNEAKRGSPEAVRKLRFSKVGNEQRRRRRKRPSSGGGGGGGGGGRSLEQLPAY